MLSNSSMRKTISDNFRVHFASRWWPLVLFHSTGSFCLAVTFHAFTQRGASFSSARTRCTNLTSVRRFFYISKDNRVAPASTKLRLRVYSICMSCSMLILPRQLIFYLRRSNVGHYNYHTEFTPTQTQI